MSKEQQFLNELDAKLWKAADKLRSSLDAANYKHIVLGLIFLKYVSDAFEERQEQLVTLFKNKGNEDNIYRNESGAVKLDVRLDGDTVWLSQKMMAELYKVVVPTINEHIKNILIEGELDQISTIRKFRIVQIEGNREVSREVDFYNLDMILSVGYRVKSATATQFRIWATKTLKEYIIKGFVLDDERLKNPDQPFDYFEELTRRIQDIRTSEKRFYRKITDIYALSVER